MKLIKSIKDIDILPTVLEVELVNIYLIDLIGILRRDKTESLKGAEAINDLIARQSYNVTGLSVDASEVVLKWIKENYDSRNTDLVDCQTANLANPTCISTKIYLENLLSISSSMKEREELEEALSEIQVRS